MKYEQQQLPMAVGSSRQFEPIAEITQGAARYAAQKGLSYDPSGLEHTQVDPVRGFAQQQAYREAETQPPSARTLRSYESMRKQVNEQYDFMTAPRESGGMGLRMEVTDENPYDTPEEMVNDVRSSGRVKVLSTASTGGHALFSNEENDRFRAVHDVFGHMGIGRGFSRHGEEAAYQSHRQMFTPAAHEALASETRGQNSYLNFNPAGASFPEQSEHVVGMPQWATGTERFEGTPEALEAQKHARRGTRDVQLMLKHMPY